MHVLKLKKPTVRQLKKLLAGHPVKLMKGRGFQLIVHPENYDIASGCFNRGMPTMVQLSPEEIEMNTPTPEEHQVTAGTEPKNKKFEPLAVGKGFTGLKAPRMSSVPETHRHVMEMEDLGYRTGHKFGTRSRAGLGNLYANEASAKLANAMNSVNSYEVPRIVGRGLRPEGVGVGGNLIGKYNPHALQSQPYSANFQWQHTLPPQYHKFNNSV
jgi:hypothetical protein